jgi:hypothetical protein
VTVTNLFGLANSSSATLAIIAPPSILNQATPYQAKIVGSSLTLSVSAAGDALVYQWRFNGTNLTNNASGNSADLALSNLQLSDDGSYSVVITNLSGSVTSTVAIVRVGLPPSITAQPIDQTATTGDDLTLIAAVSGTKPLSYQWRLSGALIPDATTNSLRLNPVQPSNAGSYILTITNLFGTASTTGAVLTVLDPPRITREPTSQIVTQGASFTFRVTATGTPTLHYQWRFNGANLPGGGLLNSYTLSNIKSNNAGIYDVIVSNDAGSDTSDPASLKVLTAFPVIAPFSKADTTFSTTFPSQLGFKYTLEAAASLTNPGWTSLGFANGTGNPLTLTDPNATTTNRFYRIRVE